MFLVFVKAIPKVKNILHSLKAAGIIALAGICFSCDGFYYARTYVSLHDMKSCICHLSYTRYLSELQVVAVQLQSVTARPRVMRCSGRSIGEQQRDGGVTTFITTLLLLLLLRQDLVTASICFAPACLPDQTCPTIQILLFHLLFPFLSILEHMNSLTTD